MTVSPIGSDIWTPMEKRLFKKAFCAHKKDFYLIHKTVRHRGGLWRQGLASHSRARAEGDQAGCLSAHL